MHVTRVAKDGNSKRTTVPAAIFKALGISDHDYVYWTWNTKGYAEVRPLPKADRLAKMTDKK